MGNTGSNGQAAQPLQSSLCRHRLPPLREWVVISIVLRRQRNQPPLETNVFAGFQELARDV